MPLVNGKSIAWSNVEPVVMRNGAPAKIIMAFRGCDYDDTTDGEIVMGAGREPFSRTEGNYVPGGMSMKWLHQDFRSFAAGAVGADGLPLSTLDFMIQFNFKFLGGTVVDYDRVFFSFNSLADSMANGSAAPLETDIGCLLLKVERWFGGVKISL